MNVSSWATSPEDAELDGAISGAWTGDDGTAMTVADIKMILRPAIERLSSGIILAHNHPSDNPNPSMQDDRLTERVHQACKVMDIQLVDHIIVCRGGRYYSYNDHGRLL